MTAYKEKEFCGFSEAFVHFKKMIVLQIQFFKICRSKMHLYPNVVSDFFSLFPVHCEESCVSQNGAVSIVHRMPSYIDTVRKFLFMFHVCSDFSPKQN